VKFYHHVYLVKSMLAPVGLCSWHSRLFYANPTNHKFCFNSKPTSVTHGPLRQGGRVTLSQYNFRK